MGIIKPNNKITSTLTKDKPEFTPSKYQQAILDAVLTDDCNILVDAKAGSGKTSTLKLIQNALAQRGEKCTILAFNKHIVAELEKKMPNKDMCNIATIPSMGLKFLIKYIYGQKCQWYLRDGKLDKTKPFLTRKNVANRTKQICEELYTEMIKSAVIEMYNSSLNEAELDDLHKCIISDLASLCDSVRMHYDVEWNEAINKINITDNAINHRLMLDNYNDLDEYVINNDVLRERLNLTELVRNTLQKRIDEFLALNGVDYNGVTYIGIEYIDMVFFPIIFKNRMSIPNNVIPFTKYIMCDECIPLSHYIVTNTGKRKLTAIKKDIELGKSVLVKSFNEQLEKFEYKPILNFVDKGIKDVYEIETNGLNKIQATDNHPFMTQTGWKQLKDIKIGEDYVYLDKPENQKTKYIPNDDQLQLILGSILGDGSLQKVSNNDYEYRLKFTQGQKQLNYLKFKQNMLQCTEPYSSKSGYTGKNSIYSTTSKVFILPYKSRIDIIRNLDARGLAILYMDDGSKCTERQYSGVKISCNSFNIDEVNALIDKLAEYNVVSYNRPAFHNGKYYNELCIHTEDAKKFFKLIAPYMHSDCFYKNPDSTGTYSWDNQWKLFGGNIVKSVKYVGKKHVCDIEVQDNHNFFVSKGNNNKCSSILVHNCQDLNVAQQKLLKRLYTNETRYIFVRRF